MKTGCCLIFTGTDNKELAQKIASILVKDDLAACIHIDEIESFYKWECKLENSKEFRLIIKAASSKYEEIEKVILQNHNYDLPEIVKLNIDGGLASYLKWINKEYPQ